MPAPRMLHGGRELPLRVELALERHERNRARTHRLLVLLTSLALAALIFAADVRGGGGSGAASRLHEVGSDSATVRWQQDRPSAGEKVISAADVHGGGGGSGAASSLHEVGSDSASVRWQENCPSAGEVKVYVAVENAPKRRVEVLLFGGGGAGSTGHALLSSTAPDEAPRDAARRALADTLGLRGAADVEFVERLGNAKCTFVAYVRKTKLDAAARQTAALRGNHNLPLAEAAAASADERGRFWLDVVALAAQAGERRGVGADIGEDALRLETVLEPFILTAGLAPGAECPTKPGWRKP